MPGEDLHPGLIPVHGNQAESLRDLLVAWMKQYPLAPLERETVLVQSNGIAQWLKLSLAADEAEGGCGIAAGLDFLLPSRFLWQVYRAVLGREAVPETSPFDESRLTWRLMRLLPVLLAEPVFQPLERFLAEDADLRKRYQLSVRLADLFDQYQVYRADWLAAWAAGEDVLIDARGMPRPLPEDQRWQGALWRHLRDDVAAGEGGLVLEGGRSEVHRAFLERATALAHAPRPPGLPRRVLVFGISSLPRQSLEVLAAMAQWSQVLMCVHNPCRHFWADIVSGQDLLRRRRPHQLPKAGRPEVLSEDQLHLHAHPLLAAWGKQGRDYIALLEEHDDALVRAACGERFGALGERIDLFVDKAGETLLEQLQQDILELVPLAEIRERAATIDPERDASLRFHIAHSRQREVEILHDQLLAAFNADAGLRPRDVIVMVPDIDAYAPHIEAVFGLLPADDPRYIPFSLADRGRRGFDPLINALETLLGLPQSRLAVSDVLDLLEVPALRRRFGIEDDDLPVLHRWIRGANIRWGLNGAHRAALGLPPGEDAAQNSWLFGLRRMLLGYAAGQDAPAWQGIEPYDEIGGLDAARLGPLADLLVRLERTWQELRTPAAPARWGERLRRLLGDWFAPEAAGDAYTVTQLEAAIESWLEACAEVELDEALPLSVVSEALLSALDGGGLSQRFFAGAVTFATLMPMRAIPFRMVCLLGMNDGDYPRSRPPLDFDLMGRDYRPGDRSRREDDRYLFLEALLSARERLHISWVGRSIHDNSDRPPSVLVGQLRDHLAAGWQYAGGGRLLDALSVAHPLQPFSPACFPPQGSGSVRFSYAREWLAAEVETVAEAPLAPPEREEPLSLVELADFLKEPVRAFFRQRLKVSFERESLESEDVEPFALDPLQAWALQDELIKAQLVAVEQGGELATAREAALAAIRRRGEIASGAFGLCAAATLAEPMEGLFAEYLEACGDWPRQVDEVVELRLAFDTGDARLELADWLDGLRLAADGEARAVIAIEPSALVDGKGSYRGEKLTAYWLRHLAWQCAAGPVSGVVLSKKGAVRFEPVAAAEAEALLAGMVEAWLGGMCRPLPLATRTAFAWLRNGDGEARTAYEGGFNHVGERDRSAYLLRTWPDYEALVADGGFYELAGKLFGPLQQAMHVAREKRE